MVEGGHKDRGGWQQGKTGQGRDGSDQAAITCRPVCSGLLLGFVKRVSLTGGRPLAPLPLLVAHPNPAVAHLPPKLAHCPLCISGNCLDTGWLLASSHLPSTTDRPAKTEEVAFKHLQMSMDSISLSLC